MARLSAVLCCALLFAALATQTVSGADEKKENGTEPVGEVLVLDDKNWDKIVPEHDLLLVEFYAPWCGHCKQLEPKYNEAAKLLADKDETKTIRIAKVDADSQKSVGARFGVSGFPTIKLFRGGEVAEEFDGERTAEGIVDYMKKKAAVAANKEITSSEVLKKLINKKSITKPTVVGFFSDKGGVDFKIFKSVVAKYAGTGVEVYHTSSNEVLEAMGFYSSGSAVHLYRPLAKPHKVVFRGTLFKQKLHEWILANAVPSVGWYTPETAKLYQLSGSQIIRFVAEDVSSFVTLKYLEQLSRHTTKEQNVKFALSELKDYKADVEAQCAKGLKVCLLAHDLKGGVFGLQKEYNEDNVEEFIQDFVAKKLKQSVKSEAIPAPAAAGEVVSIVGTTFEEMMNSDKDFLIKFYAPWCGHCKQLAPKWEELAKGLKDQFDSVAIAKFDMTSNDLPAEFKDAYKVEGFPTLYFSKKGERQQPKSYEGKREVDDLKKWIDTVKSK